MITVRYYAAARAAAGVSQDQVDASTPEILRKVIAERHGERFARVLAVSSVLLDGRPLDEYGDVPDGAVVEVLPPFAGG